MMRPSPSTRIRSACRPMASSTSCRWPGRPRSSVTEMVRTAARSSPGWVMLTIRPPVRCLRSSIQNIGGEAGFSRDRVV